MKFLYEKEGLYICECECCGFQVKLKKSMVRVQNTIGMVQDFECFCGEVVNTIRGLPEEKTDNIDSDLLRKLQEQTQVQPQFGVPHCPTCGSTNVEKISLGSKAVGGYMFGLFSSNIRRTYRCNDCKYKW